MSASTSDELALGDQSAFPFSPTPALTAIEPGPRGPGLQPVSEITNAANEFKQHVLSRIENIFHSVTVDLSHHRTPTVQIRSRSTARLQDITYPGSNEKEAWRFAVLLRMLELVHQALTEEVITTKRDIYYKDKALFQSQGNVDRYIDDIAYTFNVQRSVLNVAATAKGLVLGCFAITRADGSIVDGESDPEGMLVPDLVSTDIVDLSSVSWVLVIEKEATFRAIAHSRLHSSSPRRKGIIVTAKGYPDIATRSFLHRLHARDRLVPMFALVDWDPDGMAIHHTYAHGSKRLAHETHALELPGLSWLGVKSGDVVPACQGGSPTQGTGAGDVRDVGGDGGGAAGSPDSTAEEERDGLLPLTGRDRRKAVAMLRAASGGLDRDEGERMAELRLMLMLDVKADIQALEYRGGVEDWLRRKLNL